MIAKVQTVVEMENSFVVYLLFEAFHVVQNFKAMLQLTLTIIGL